MMYVKTAKGVSGEKFVFKSKNNYDTLMIISRETDSFCF